MVSNPYPTKRCGLFSTSDYEIWNLTDGGRACVGALDRFLVVGRVRDPHACPDLSYRVNDGPASKVAINRSSRMTGRMEPGSLGIDSICTSELGPENVLEIRAGNRTDQVSFELGELPDLELTDFATRVAASQSVEELGQVVDGRWEVHATERTVRLAPASAGYDRVLLFTRALLPDYRIKAELEVECFTRPIHNVGLVFDWNDHSVGDGTVLPATWNTGLAYFYSSSPGLRLRVGVGVHLDSDGKKVGDHVLAEKSISALRHWGGRVISRLPPRPLIVSQLRPGVRYSFTAEISDSLYRLELNNQADRLCAIETPARHNLLPRGAAGIIALNTSVAVHSFSIERITIP